MLKWILGGLAVLLLGGLVLVVDREALARARALDDGSAESRTAVMTVHRDRNHFSTHNRYDLTASFADPDTGKLIDGGFEAVGMEGPEGITLRKHTGDEVTVYLYYGEVIAVRLDDGDLIKRDNVGWRGFSLHWSLAVLVLGLVLLAAGLFFEVGGAGSVGVALLVLGGVGFLFLTFPWVALAAAVLVIGLAGWLVWNEATRQKSGKKSGKKSGGKSGKKKGAGKRG